ncbi:hypothetical protein F6Y05_34880 [Bacillus megaterium]|nr:hypothetical protein [Priestia megaterium]
MSALNALTETNQSNKLTSEELSYQEASNLETLFVNDEEQLARVFPDSTLSQSALVEEERIEKEITQVFGNSTLNCSNKIVDIKDKIKKEEQTNQANNTLPPSILEDRSNDIQRGLSQLTLDILINETEETTPPNTSDINEEKAATGNTTDDLSTYSSEEKDSITPEDSNKNESKETVEPSNVLGKSGEKKELSNTTVLDTKELDSIDEENSYISSIPTELKQTEQEASELEELDATAVNHNSVNIVKKTVKECDNVTINYIAECIADRTITKYKHFELCIKDSWKLKPGKKPKHLAKLTSEAKGGDVSNPVQDMEFLKRGLKNLLIKL